MESNLLVLTCFNGTHAYNDIKLQSKYWKAKNSFSSFVLEKLSNKMESERERKTANGNWMQSESPFSPQNFKFTQNRGFGIFHFLSLSTKLCIWYFWNADQINGTCENGECVCLYAIKHLLHILIDYRVANKKKCRTNESSPGTIVKHEMLKNIIEIVCSLNKTSKMVIVYLATDSCSKFCIFLFSCFVFLLGEVNSKIRRQFYIWMRLSLLNNSVVI